MPRLFGGYLSDTSSNENENNMGPPHRNGFEIHRDIDDLSGRPLNENTTNSTSSYRDVCPEGPTSSPPGSPIPTKIHSINHTRQQAHSPPPTFKSKGPPPPPPTRRSGSPSNIKLPNSPATETHGRVRFITLTSPAEPTIPILVKTPTNNPHPRLSKPSTAQEVRTQIPTSGSKYPPSSEQIAEETDPIKTTTTSQSTTVRHSRADAPRQNTTRGFLLDVRNIEILLFSLLLLLTLHLGCEIARRGEKETLVLVVRP